jgi:glutathione synthase/RimK-type ligase-like ATP-grasp enzyme
MPHVLLLTAETLPAGAHDFDTQVLGSALGDRGVHASALPWTIAAQRTEGVDGAVIRTTWDYTFRLGEFLASIETFPVPVANPPAVIRWNAHKGYLAELGAGGVDVVPTVLIRRGEPAEIAGIGADRIIVKPASSAGARGVGLFDADSPAARVHLHDLLKHGDALVQPFEPSVHDGERSLIFLGGTYSHAVRKVPAAGDFRVQTRYGGQVLRHQATGPELDVAAAALDRISEPLLYARVDLIGPPQQPLLMELELIEPELFLPMSADSAGRLADLILERL